MLKMKNELKGRVVRKATGPTLLLLLIMFLLVMPQVTGMSLAAPNLEMTPASHALSPFLSDGQFVYGPNVAGFDLYPARA